jgi:hypothetical protein
VRDVRQQRIDQGRLALEERRPIGVGEPLAHRRDGPKIINRGDLVVAAPVPDRRRIELPRQPLAAVDVDLDLVGPPSLQPHRHPAKLGIDPVQTCAAGGPPPDAGSAVGRDRERAVGLQSTHTRPCVTPSCSAIARASLEAPERGVLARAKYSIGRPAAIASDTTSSRIRCVSASKNRPPRQVAAERPIGEETVQMPLEDHPVERVDHA